MSELSAVNSLRTEDQVYGFRKANAARKVYMVLNSIRSNFAFGWNFWQPGLEVLYACEQAEAQGANLVFIGAELNGTTWNNLLHETRVKQSLQSLFKRLTIGKRWGREETENRVKTTTNTAATFAEKCMDQEMCNWYIQYLSKVYPSMKRILIDQKDEELFQQIDKTEGKKIVVVVNQWHMEGIEHHWCHRYGQIPRNVNFPEGINPIGDMNLREGLFEKQYNILHRQIVCSNSKAEPTTLSNWITGYHREADWHYHHRNL